MSIRVVVVTEIEDVDRQLALAVKWIGNGSLSMGASHILNASMELHRRGMEEKVDRSRIQAFLDFVDQWFYRSGDL